MCSKIYFIVNSIKTNRDWELSFLGVSLIKFPMRSLWQARSETVFEPLSTNDHR